MMHPGMRVAFINEAKGLGLIAAELIPAGTITYVCDPLDIVIPRDDPRLADPLYAAQITRYGFTDANGSYIVSWDHGRFVNHCCQPNTVSMANGCDIAIRDIAPGEEVTEDYGLWRLPAPLALSCEQPGCRGTVGEEESPSVADWSDEQVKRALLNWRNVSQPLLPLIEDAAVREMDAFATTGEGYRSVREQMCEPWD